MILAPSAVLILFFFKLREDKHTTNDSNKASPGLIHRWCLLLFSFLSPFGSRHGQPPASPHSPDVFYSHGKSEELCRPARSWWCLETPLGACCMEKQPKPISRD